MHSPLSILDFIMLALAVYRGAILISTDDGPFDLCWRLRDYVRLHTADIPATQMPDGTQFRQFVKGGDPGFIASNLSRGISCPLCVSMWLGLLVAPLWWLAPLVVWWLCLPFALSGVTVLIERIGKDVS